MKRMKTAYSVGTSLEDDILEYAHGYALERNGYGLSDIILDVINSEADNPYSENDMVDVIDHYGAWVDVWQAFRDWYGNEWAADLEEDFIDKYEVPDGYETWQDYLDDEPIDDEREARRRRAMMARRRNRRR